MTIQIGLLKCKREKAALNKMRIAYRHSISAYYKLLIAAKMLTIRFCGIVGYIKQKEWIPQSMCVAVSAFVWAFHQVISYSVIKSFEHHIEIVCQ